MTVAQPTPIIPYLGMSAMFSAMLITAAQTTMIGFQYAFFSVISPTLTPLPVATKR